MAKDMFLVHEIIGQLRLCGHSLHYKMGGRAGRRRVLTVLLEQQEILQRDLQDILGVQSGSLSEMIIGMEADGLVEKVKSKKDGRHLVLRLTPKGIRQAERSKEEYERQIEKMMSCFSEEQMKNLHHLLNIMITHWTELEKDSDVKIPDTDQKQDNE